MEYTESELDVICDSCCSIFLLVASSDNNIHKEEENFFLNHYQDILSGLHIISDPREKAVLEFWAQDRFTHQHILEMKSDSAVVHMARIRAGLTLVQKKENKQGHLQYKTALMTLAVNISKAARGLWGLGGQVSRKEEKALKELSALLKVPPLSR